MSQRQVDQVPLIYPGRVHAFLEWGPVGHVLRSAPPPGGVEVSCGPASGRDWLALHLAAQIVRAAGEVAWVDFSGQGREMARRLVSLDLDEASLNRFHHLDFPPDTMQVPSDMPTRLGGYPLVVIEGDPAFPGWDFTLRRLAAVGPAVVRLGLLTPGAAVPFDLSAIDGTAYEFDGFYPDEPLPGEGPAVSRLTLLKDGVGQVADFGRRAPGPEDHIADLRMERDFEGRVHLGVLTPVAEPRYASTLDLHR